MGGNMLKVDCDNRSILIVDPDEGCRRNLRMVLRNIGFTLIFEAESAVQALKIVQKHKLELIISEVHLPKISGVQLLRGLRGHRKLAAWSVPFLLTTQFCEKGLVISARDSGADGFVAKPVLPAVLIKRLNELFSGNRLIFDLWLAKSRGTGALDLPCREDKPANPVTIPLRPETDGEADNVEDDVMMI